MQISRPAAIAALTITALSMHARAAEDVWTRDFAAAKEIAA